MKDYLIIGIICLLIVIGGLAVNSLSNNTNSTNNTTSNSYVAQSDNVPTTSTPPTSNQSHQNGSTHNETSPIDQGYQGSTGSSNVQNPVQNPDTPSKPRPI